MKKNAYLFVGLLSLAACSKPAASAHYLAEDFFVTVLPADQHLVMAVAPATGAVPTRAECETHLTQAVCETTVGADQILRNYSRVKCSGNGAQYVPALMSIYDEMPALMRPSLCSLDRVFLSDGITSTAFASSVTDQLGRRLGGYVGMRRGTFLQQPSTHDLVTWKEQLAYGGSPQFLSNDPKLVQIEYNLKMSTLKTDGLFYVLMHELGHLIDFGNHINADGRMTDWNQLSWQNDDAPFANATFYKRDDFCFYNCQQFLNPSDAKQIYSSLQQSAFVSSYSASNPWEDFAEFWAWRMMLEFKSPDYKITVPGAGTFNMMPAFAQNAKIKQKIDFVTALWNSPTLKVDNRVTP